MTTISQNIDTAREVAEQALDDIRNMIEFTYAPVQEGLDRLDTLENGDIQVSAKGVFRLQILDLPEKLQAEIKTVVSKERDQVLKRTSHNSRTLVKAIIDVKELLKKAREEMNEKEVEG